MAIEVDLYGIDEPRGCARAVKCINRESSIDEGSSVDDDAVVSFVLVWTTLAIPVQRIAHTLLSFHSLGSTFECLGD